MFFMKSRITICQNFQLEFLVDTGSANMAIAGESSLVSKYKMSYTYIENRFIENLWSEAFNIQYW